MRWPDPGASRLACRGVLPSRCLRDPRLDAILVIPLRQQRPPLHYGSVRAAPHSPQNFCPGELDAPQAGHEAARRAPHSPQNF